jgi:hypothetical protein
MYFKVTTARALTALLFLLSLSCSKQEPLIEQCEASAYPLEDLVAQDIASGHPALNAAALLGSSLELNENVHVHDVPAFYGYYDCKDQRMKKQQISELEPCGFAAFNSCGEGVSSLDVTDCGKGALGMYSYTVRLETLNASSLPYCPVNWEDFLANSASTLVKHFDYTANRGYNAVEATTYGDLGGWDATVSLSPTSAERYGIKLTQSISGKKLKIHGARIKSYGIWDQTFSSESLKLSANPTYPAKFTVDSGNQEVAVQENIGRFTAKLSVSGLTYDLKNCGCIPESGQIKARFYGNRSGTEVITFEAGPNSCGKYKLEQIKDDGSLKGPAKFGTLNYCL